MKVSGSSKQRGQTGLIYTTKVCAIDVPSWLCQACPPEHDLSATHLTQLKTQDDRLLMPPPMPQQRTTMLDLMGRSRGAPSIPPPVSSVKMNDDVRGDLNHASDVRVCTY
jgi:hypothetical protein